MAVLGLRFCARAFSSCGKQGPLFIAVCRPLAIAAPLVAEHRLQTRRLSNCGSRAQLLRGTWDLPRPGLEPVFPALAGRLSTTAPPGKPFFCFFISAFLCYSSHVFLFPPLSHSSLLPESAFRRIKCYRNVKLLYHYYSYHLYYLCQDIFKGLLHSHYCINNLFL